MEEVESEEKMTLDNVPLSRLGNMPQTEDLLKRVLLDGQKKTVPIAAFQSSI